MMDIYCTIKIRTKYANELFRTIHTIFSLHYFLALRYIDGWMDGWIDK